MNRGSSQGCDVFLEKPPEAERGPATMGTGRVWTCWCPTITEQDTTEEVKGHFCQERPHWGKGGPSMGPSSYSRVAGEDWKAEPVCHQGPARCPCPFLELWPLEEKVPGAEQEVLQGLTGGQSLPFPHTQPSLMGPKTLEDEEAEQPFLEFDLGPPPELGPDVNCFLQELANKSRENRKSDSSLEPPVEEYERWVMWGTGTQYA